MLVSDGETLTLRICFTLRCCHLSCLPLEEDYHHTVRGRGGEGRGAERKAHSPQEAYNLQELQYYEV